MKLLNQTLLKEFARVGSQEQSKDPLVICRYFGMRTSRERYATEYDADTGIFFGFVRGHFNER